jgi:hypothetical protein
MAANAQQVSRLSLLLEHKVSAMHELCQALAASLPAMMNLDLAGIEQSVVRQSELCETISSIDSKLQRVTRRSTSEAAFALDVVDSDADAESLARLRLIVEELRAMQKEAARLSRTASELIRRSRISNLALLNAISQQTSLTYSNPLERFSHAERG